nr:MAG: hypothetical protein [Metapenaeus ensis nimavirus]
MPHVKGTLEVCYSSQVAHRLASAPYTMSHIIGPVSDTPPKVLLEDDEELLPGESKENDPTLVGHLLSPISPDAPNDSSKVVCSPNHHSLTLLESSLGLLEEKENFPEEGEDKEQRPSKNGEGNKNKEERNKEEHPYCVMHEDRSSSKKPQKMDTEAHIREEKMDESNNEKEEEMDRANLKEEDEKKEEMDRANFKEEDEKKEEIDRANLEIEDEKEEEMDRTNPKEGKVDEVKKMDETNNEEEEEMDGMNRKGQEMDEEKKMDEGNNEEVEETVDFNLEDGKMDEGNNEEVEETVDFNLEDGKMDGVNLEEKKKNEVKKIDEAKNEKGEEMDVDVEKIDVENVHDPLGSQSNYKVEERDLEEGKKEKGEESQEKDNEDEQGDQKTSVLTPSKCSEECGFEDQTKNVELESDANTEISISTFFEVKK